MNRQGESQFPQAGTEPHKFLHNSRYTYGEFLWKTMVAFVEIPMIRLTNQSEIERNFTLPDRGGLKQQDPFKWACKGLKHLLVSYQSRSRPKPPQFASTGRTEAADPRFVFPTGIKHRIRLKTNERHAEGNGRLGRGAGWAPVPP